MSVLKEWQAARSLPVEIAGTVRRLAEEPAAELRVSLPAPPGINDWWEPFTLRRRGRVVASLRLTKDAVAYKRLAERILLEAGSDPVELEDTFHDLWLDLRVTSYLTTPLERDADGPVKPLQDLFCSLLGVDDARVRHSSGTLLLDPLDPRVEVWLRGLQVWDSSGHDGPYYTVATHVTPAGPRTEPRIVTARRVPAARAMQSPPGAPDARR